MADKVLASATEPRAMPDFLRSLKDEIAQSSLPTLTLYPSDDVVSVTQFFNEDEQAAFFARYTVTEDVFASDVAPRLDDYLEANAGPQAVPWNIFEFGDGLVLVEEVLPLDIRVVFAEAGSDSIIAANSIDTVFGGDGNDRIRTASTVDRPPSEEAGPVDRTSDQTTAFYGEAGNDTLIADQGVALLSGGDGDDQISSYDAPGDAPHRDTLLGGDGDDLIFIGMTDDQDMSSRETIGDLVDAGRGNDRVTGGSARDDMTGGAGDDILVGRAGPDLIFGGTGDDSIWAADPAFEDDARDTLAGGSGNDSILGSSGGQLMRGGDGDDTIDGGADGSTADRDTLNGGEGNDVLRSGQSGRVISDLRDQGDLMVGGEGADTLVAGTANDEMHGGAGADTFVFDRRFGHDLIVDFEPGEGDRIDLLSLGPINRSKVMLETVQGGLVVTYDRDGDGMAEPGYSITLIGQAAIGPIASATDAVLL